MVPRMLRPALLFPFVLLSAAVVAPPIAGAAEELTGRPRVVDGNRLAFGETRVRLFGIDAPEARQRCTSADGRDWACGLHAARHLHNVTKERDVRCEPREGDARGQLVAVCRTGGVDLARAMVRAGFAIALPHVTRDYTADERAAREEQAGLWSGVFETPASWRRKNPEQVLP
jgi:endonuclease YncB( thermonuclease family)